MKRNELAENYWCRLQHAEMPGGLKCCSVLHSCLSVEYQLTNAPQNNLKIY